MKNSDVNNTEHTSATAPFVRRFFTYQKERFPFLVHGVMITAFMFSAISYSRICRHQSGFIELSDFFIGIFATITLFFLVRIFDEFKDKEDDAKYRKYLPVPRGLISLTELRNIGIVIGIAQLTVILVFQPKMILLYVMVLGYLLLMGVEFFVPKWIKKRQILYITSHMFIIPLVDIYASGLDWLLDGDSAHWGLAWFFAVSYMNGLVLEFGRKIRTKEKEEPGVVSYTGVYGEKGAVFIWLGLLIITMSLAFGAMNYAGFGGIAFIVLIGIFLIAALPGVLFILNPTVKGSKFIEYASVLWTVCMYFSLGGIPMLTSLLA